MGVGSSNVQRYRAKAARRPFLFWWQAFVLLAVILCLWSQLPVTAVLFEPRGIPPLPDARVAFVVLDPKYAAQAFKKPLTAWTSGGLDEKTVPGLEIGGIDLGKESPPPEYLEQGARYPGVWQPSAVDPLPVRFSDICLPSPPDTSENLTVSAPPQGIRVAPDEALEKAAFSFPSGKEALPERTGHCRFYVETDPDGTVKHLLLLTPRTPGAAAFELMLLRGRTSGAARGSVDIYWMYPK